MQSQVAVVRPLLAATGHIVGRQRQSGDESAESPFGVSSLSAKMGDHLLTFGIGKSQMGRYDEFRHHESPVRMSVISEFYDGHL
jgi:hypothetical protein